MCDQSIQWSVPDLLPCDVSSGMCKTGVFSEVVQGVPDHVFHQVSLTTRCVTKAFGGVMLGVPDLLSHGTSLAWCEASVFICLKLNVCHLCNSPVNARISFINSVPVLHPGIVWVHVKTATHTSD